MAPTSDRHAETADALKALAEGAPRKRAADADGFVGPEPPDEAGAGADAVDAALPSEAAVRSAIRPEAPPGPSEPLAAAPPLSVGSPPDLAGRTQRSADFEQRSRQAHAHQYKVMMIPLLLTLGAILIVMGLWALLRSGGAEAGAPGGEDPAQPPLVKWFPLLALPLGAILLAGAWWFHLDVKRKRQ